MTTEGQETTRYGPGAVLGRSAPLRDVPRQATVTAITDVRLRTPERSHFLFAVTGSRSAAMAANTVIDERLAEG